MKYKNLPKSFEKDVTKTEGQVVYKVIFTPKSVLLTEVVIIHICKKLKSVNVWRLVCTNTMHIYIGGGLVLLSQSLFKERECPINTAYTDCGGHHQQPAKVLMQSLTNAVGQ